MFRKIQKHLSPASLLAMVALFVALGGVSYAAATINGKNIKDNTIAGKKLKGKAVTGAKVKGNTLTGAHVDESKLGKVPSAATADQAGNAATAANATNAVNATTAANASAIADDTVSSVKVQDGTLTGRDVGRRSGDTSASIGNVVANSCVAEAISIDPTGADMRDDAFAITADDTWPTGLVFSSESSDAAGYVRVNVCNVTGAPIDAGVQLFHWVAFDS
jgi:hypothetical protein